MKIESDWGKFEGSKNSTTPFMQDLILKNLPVVPEESTVLDYGSGEGRVLNFWHQLGVKPESIYGVEPSEEMIERCAKEQSHLSKNNFLITDEFFPELPKFDVISFMGVGVCIVDDTVLDSIAKRMKELLKPNGFVYVVDFLQTSSKDVTYNEFFKSAPCKYPWGVYKNKDGKLFYHRPLSLIKCIYGKYFDLDIQEITLTSINNHKYSGFVGIFKPKN